MDERERIFEKAEEVGRLISQVAEYAYLQTAHREIGDDREATEMLSELREMQEKLLETVGRGEKPAEEDEQAFTDLQERIQTSARYQALIAAQANFDKLMERVNRAIGEGIRKGEESRIILPS